MYIVINTKKITIQLFQPETIESYNSKKRKGSETSKLGNSAQSNNSSLHIQRESSYSQAHSNYNNYITAPFTQNVHYSNKTSSSFDNETNTSRYLSAKEKEYGKLSISEKGNDSLCYNTGSSLNVNTNTYSTSNSVGQTPHNNKHFNSNPIHNEKYLTSNSVKDNNSDNYFRKSVLQSNTGTNVFSSSCGGGFGNINLKSHINKKSVLKTHKINLNSGENKRVSESKVKEASNKENTSGKTIHTMSTMNTLNSVVHNQGGNKFNSHTNANLKQNNNKKIIKNNMNKYNCFPTYFKNLNSNGPVAKQVNPPNNNYPTEVSNNAAIGSEKYKRLTVEESPVSNNPITPNKINDHIPNQRVLKNQKSPLIQTENKVKQKYPSLNKFINLQSRQVNGNRNESYQPDNIMTTLPSPENKIKKYAALFDLISSNLKEIKDLMKTSNKEGSDPNKYNEEGIKETIHQVLSPIRANDDGKSIKFSANFFDENKLIKDYELETSQEQIQRLIEANTNFRNENRRNRKLTKISNYPTNTQQIQGTNFVFHDPRNDNSFLFSSFNSDMYRNLVNDPNNEAVMQNLSLDLTSIKNCKVNNNMPTISNTIINNDKSGWVDKTEQTECQFDDVVFNGSKNPIALTKKEPIRKKSSKLNLSRLNIDDRLLFEVDNTVNALSYEDTYNVMDSVDKNQSQGRDQLPISELK